MALAVNPSYTEDFILPSDLSSSASTVWHIGVLDTLLRVHIDDEHTNITSLLKGVRMSDADMHHKYLDMVRFGLRGWENFKDASGTPIAFMAQPVDVPKVGIRMAVTDECLNRIDIVDVMLIGRRIAAINNLTKEQRKN